MKPWRLTRFLFVAVVVLAACQRPAVETRRGTSIQSSELLDVDSLLWTQPDSALTCLMACYDTVGDRHYANLLLAELLYKNDYEQTNRTELLAAVAYYDSVSDPFLAARAHYINGVGYYERDSVVPASEQYLKAVEIMEEHFTEKELVGQKAKFMALTYTHLCELFSDQYLHEQAFYFGKQALPYYYRYKAEPWHIVWVMEEIGAYFEIMKQWDSAEYYYQQACNELKGSTGITYRDYKTRQLVLSYKTNTQATDSVINQLFDLLTLAESDQERLARCLSLGSVLYYSQQYDSAYFYLYRVFENAESIGLKKLAAEWLVEICKYKGLPSEPYATFLVPFANQEENNGITKSKLATLFNEHERKRQDVLQEKTTIKTKRGIKTLSIFLVSLFLIMISFFFINKRRKRYLKKQIEEKEDYLTVRELQYAATVGKMRNELEQLKTEKKKLVDNQILGEKHKENKLTKIPQEEYISFLKEQICIYIRYKLTETEKYSSYDVKDYKQLALTKKELTSFIQATERHCPDFSRKLKTLYPELRSNDITLCRFFLLNPSILQVAILLNTDYSSIRRRVNRLKQKMNTEDLFLQIKSSLFETD